MIQEKLGAMIEVNADRGSSNPTQSRDADIKSKEYRCY